MATLAEVARMNGTMGPLTAQSAWRALVRRFLCHTELSPSTLLVCDNIGNIMLQDAYHEQLIEKFPLQLLLSAFLDAHHLARSWWQRESRTSKLMLRLAARPHDAAQEAFMRDAIMMQRGLDEDRILFDVHDVFAWAVCVAWKNGGRPAAARSAPSFSPTSLHMQAEPSTFTPGNVAPGLTCE